MGRVQVQALKRGHQLSKTADVAEGATIHDLITRIAQFKNCSTRELFAAQIKFQSTVKLHGSELPKGNLQIGGLQDLEGIPDIFAVVPSEGQMSSEQAIEVLESFVAAYSEPAVQEKVKEAQKKIRDGQLDPKMFTRETRDVVHQAQDGVLPRFGFPSGAEGIFKLNIVMQGAQAGPRGPEVKALQMRVNELLGLV